MKRTPFSIGLTLCLFVFLAVNSSLLRSEEDLHKVWAVKDCRIVTQAGAPIENGTIVIRDGLIESVGATVSAPTDAEVIDGNGLTVYPGLIDSLGSALLKLPEREFDQTKVLTGQYTDEDRGINPDLKAFELFEISKSTLEKYHKAGITAAQVLPERGVFSGQAAIFSLGGTEKNANIILRDTCLGVGFSVSNFMVYPSSLMGVVAMIRQELTDASYFDMHNTRWKREISGIPRPEYDRKQELLSDYAAARKPVVFFTRNQNDIRRALGLAEELKLDYFICDLGNEAFRVIPELKEAKARIFLPLTFKVPGTSIHAQKGRALKNEAEKELYAKNPALIAEAGIPFTFTSLGTDDPGSFLEGIRKAVENGLPQEKALDALTAGAAEFLGLTKALGTIESGKIANLVLLEGEILAKDAKVKHVFADGKYFEIKEPEVKDGKQPTVNVTGRWEISIEEAGLKLTVDFVQEEASLGGKLTTPFGIFDFSGGTVSGNELYFEMNISVGGQDIDLYFTGVVEDDRMTGTVVQGAEQSAEFTAKRIPGMGGTR